MNEADKIGSLLIQCPTLAAAIWIVTQALGKGIPFLRPVPQQTIAVILGPLGGMLGYYLTWIGEPGVTGAKGWIGAAFLGLVSTLIAGLAHDKIYNALLPSKIAESFRKTGP
jgi:hypothetical protein